MRCEILTPCSKELTISFYFEEVPPKKRHRIKIKPLFLLTFNTRYSNLEVNKSRTLRNMRQFQGLFLILKRSCLCTFLIYMTLPLRLGNIWYFCIRFLISNHLLKNCTVTNKNYTNDVLCVTTTNTSAQITGTQQRSQYRNNSWCILDVDDVKCLVRNVRK